MSAASLGRVADEWHRAKKAERVRAAALYKEIRWAVESGMSESEAARVAGVDRMTVRRALGKR